MSSGLDRVHPPDAERPPTRPRAVAAFAVPVAAAALVGLAVGLDPVVVAVLVAAAVLAVSMVLRLEWAVHVVVAAACFDDWLALVHPLATKALAVLLLASWLLRRTWGPLHRGDRRPVLVAAAILAGVLLLATAVHAHGGTGLDVLLRYGGFLLVLAVVADALSAGLSAASVARTFVWSATAAAVCGLAVLLSATTDDRRVAGPIGDPNDLAFLLLAAVALVPALRAASTRRIRYDLALAVLVLAIVGTLSRGAVAGLLVMVVVALVLRVMSLRAGFVVAVAVGTLTAIVLAVAPSTVETMVERKEAVAAENVEDRLDLWDAARAMTEAHPVLGVGPGGFALAVDDYRDSLPDDEEAALDVAHNTYLEIAAETGVLGLLAWLGLLVAGVTTAWSRWRADRTWLAGGVTVGLVGLATAAVFTTAQYALPLWLLLALAAGLGRRGGIVDDLLRQRG